MKKIAIRFLVGIPLGIVTSYMMCILYSLYYGEGHFIAILHTVESMCDTELEALLIQVSISGMLGSFSVSIVTLFEQANWSIWKSCLLHASSTFLILLCSAILTLYIHSISLLISVFVLLFLICAILYFQLYQYTRKQVHELNAMLPLQKGMK